MSKTILPDARQHPRFSGVATFLRFPRADDVTPANQPVDWAIYGVPFDGGVTYRPGARFAPRAIRDASAYVKRFHIEHGVDICETLSMTDAGDAPIAPYDGKQTLELAAAFAGSLGSPDFTKLMAIGGDHSVAFANVLATRHRFAKGNAGGAPGSLALIHFDAHFDTVDTVWGNRWGHASPFRRAIEQSLIDPRMMISIGIRGPLNTADDLAFARDQGIQIITADDLIFGDGLATLAAFKARVANHPCYISFDVDAVDPSHAPGTGTPVCGGPSSALVMRAIRSLRGANVVGADVVEVLPDRDASDITALLAAHVMVEILALDAARRVGLAAAAQGPVIA